MADQDPYAAIAEPASAPAGADPYASIAEPVGGGGTPPETPGFFKRLLTPDPNSGFLEHAGATLLGTVPSIYNAFAEPATEEEKARYAPGEKAAGEEPGAETSGLKRVGLGIRRLTVDPITGANLQDYTQGKISPRAALSVAPAALGTAVGAVAGGEVLGKMGEAVKKVTPGSLKESVQPFTRKFVGVESDLKKAATKAATDTAKAEGEHAEATQTAADRQALAKKLDETSMKAGQHIENVEKSVAKAADAKFKAVRDKLGITPENPGPEVPPDNMVATVREIEENVLQNIPENVKEFRAILGHGEEAEPGMRAEFKKVTGKEALGGKPFTWDELQSLKSRIDARLRKSRGMNGDLKRGLRQLRDQTVNEMGSIAEPGGASDLWADAKQFYRGYKEDFHEPTGPSGSGSPVAKALDAVDPRNIRQPFAATQSTLGNRGVDILRKYPQHGGTEAAATVEEMMGHHENLRKMGADKAIKPVKQQTLDANEVNRQSIAKHAARIGDMNARDVGIIASGGLGELIGGLFGGNFMDRAVGAATGVGMYEGAKFVGSRLLNKESVVNWLAQTPPAELQAIAKIKGIDKVRIINAITDVAVEQSRLGKLRAKYGVDPLSPAAKQLLGPANVARIMGTSAGAGVNNRKDALELLQQP